MNSIGLFIFGRKNVLLIGVTGRFLKRLTSLTIKAGFGPKIISVKMGYRRRPPSHQKSLRHS